MLGFLSPRYCVFSLQADLGGFDDDDDVSVNFVYA